jgi:hypothetical protein
MTGALLTLAKACALLACLSSWAVFVGLFT